MIFPAENLDRSAIDTMVSWFIHSREACDDTTASAVTSVCAATAAVPGTAATTVAAMSMKLRKAVLARSIRMIPFSPTNRPSSGHAAPFSVSPTWPYNRSGACTRRSYPEGISMTTAMNRNGFDRPGANNGLIDVFRRRYLLQLIVRKEVGIRYRNSVLGWLWSYVKPLVQFVVFFVALGVFLGLNKSIDYYPIYLLSGITIVTFFNEAFANGTRSLVDNAALIKKIYLPREMFPVASVLVAAVNTLPQIVVIVVISLFFGWAPSALQVFAVAFALVIIALLSTGLGMLFGAINVTFRDAQSFVEIIVMMSIWASPVMYQWQMVATEVPHWAFIAYRLNPLTPTVELFHYGLWLPLNPTGAQQLPGLWTYSLIAMLVALAVLGIGQLVFRRLEGRFAQDL